jgi:murein DD-endopeptidase MepM/ murein hydrolase activator NlpD
MMKKILVFLLIWISVSLFAIDYDFGSPLPGGYDIASPFGYRQSIGGLEEGLHRGIDMVPYAITKNKKAEVQVLAVESGIVYVVFPPPGTKSITGKVFKGHPVFGGLVILYHGNGLYSLYGHLAQTWVVANQQIRKGQALGIVGNTGVSTGPHLHFELDIDPVVLLSTDFIKTLKTYPNYEVPIPVKK